MTTRNATVERVLPDIFYEDPDPVEDGMQQELTITHLAFVLRWWFSQRLDVFVSAGGFIFWNPANGNERIEPDGSVWSHSEVLNLDFRWDGEEFSIRDPLTGETIDPRISLEHERERAEQERQARLEAEARLRRLMEEREQ